MTLRDTIEVTKADLPYSTEIDVETETFTLVFMYNDIVRGYSVDLYDADGKSIILDWRIMLNQPLWHGIVNERLPVWSIVPMDESGQAKKLTPENFGESVFLCIDDLVEGDVNGNSDD